MQRDLIARLYDMYEWGEIVAVGNAPAAQLKTVGAAYATLTMYSR